ncbi:hypothetical cyanophage protein [Synechococcus phage S-CRM01]|uniref:cytidyltransferase n=1 Tax=Synechococcus phage S-CRM01 TaxID=1026955 RepID=UPI000209E3BB|nr:cytidyltransferase [Synechococcus phage S-CRM01]AEC53073.1 hypothetical cyanophage protein [Synechococcus phage S-CRM01]
MKLFNQFFKEAEIIQPKRISDDAVRVFGRHNPGHLGHLKTLDHADKIASSIGDKAPGDLGLYTSRTQDPKKNPLPYEAKLDHLKRMFPKYADKWDPDPEIKTVLDTAKKAHRQGYKNYHFVGGGDRQQEMENLLRKYNGNLYDFKNIYAHSAGDRTEEDPDDPISSLSASKMRKHASEGNFEDFIKGLPIAVKGKGYTKQDAMELYNLLRASMGIAESWEVEHYTSHEYIREMYLNGELFEEGDYVESLTTGLSGSIKRCGTNHVICVTEDGLMFKSFINDLVLL